MGTIEHRKLFRVQTSIKITYEGVKDSSIKGEALTVDVSSIGTQIITKDQLEIGTDLSIKFFVALQKEPIFALAKVVWKRKCDYNSESQIVYYAIGLMMLDMSPQDAILTSDYIFDIAKKQQTDCEKEAISQLEAN